MSQEETELRSRLVADAQKCGYWSRSVNDRFVSGYPDMRFARQPWGQLDVELKILDCADSTLIRGDTIDSGITKLQQIELRDMNKAGAPAVGMLLIKARGYFVFCNFNKVNLQQALAGPRVWFNRLPLREICTDFEAMFSASHSYLRSLRNGRDD